METVNNLASLIGVALSFAVMAFVWTLVVYVGSWILRRKLANAQFSSMFRVTCVIFLILKIIGEALD